MIDERFDTRYFYLGHLSTLCTHLVAVVSIVLRHLIFGSTEEVVPHDKSEFEKEIDGVVECRSAHPEVHFMM